MSVFGDRLLLAAGDHGDRDPKAKALNRKTQNELELAVWGGQVQLRTGEGGIRSSQVFLHLYPRPDGREETVPITAQNLPLSDVVRV